MMIITTVNGNLGRDPEIKQVGDTQLASFSVASTGRQKVNGEWGEHTTWVNVTVWGKRADFVGRFFRKGSSILVSGELQERPYTDKNGNQRTSLDLDADRVTFAGKKSDSQQGGVGHAGGNGAGHDNGGGDDDIPF